MGIIKKQPANDNADNQAAGAAPAFEGEDGDTAVLEKTEVKTVTREQVAKDALVEKNAAAPEAGAAEQGGEQGTVSAEQHGEALASEAGSAAKAPEAAASTAVVVPGAKQGVIKHFLTAGKGMVNPLVDLKDAFKTAGIDVDYGTFPRLRVDAGCIASTEGKEAGDFIELQVLSYSPSWTVTTGTDGKESKEHVRFSDDGKVTNPAGDADEYAGTPLEEYKQILVDKGFEKAAIKEYLVVFGIALDCQEDDFPHKNEVVALSLAPESRKKFDSYKINRALQARMGRVQETSGNPVVRWTAERVSGKERSYFNLAPSHGKTAPVDLG